MNLGGLQLRSPDVRFCHVLVFVLISPVFAHSDTDYYRHVFFDNSITPDAYYYSGGRASGPSTLRLQNGKLPVETGIFFTPPNALRLEWQSMPNGGWEAEIRVVNFRNREIRFLGDTLFFWLYASQAVSATDLPFMRLLDMNGNFSAPFRLGKFAGAIRADHWVQVKIPLDHLVTGSIHTFDPHHLQSVSFGQSNVDAKPHMLIIDEIRIDDDYVSSPIDSPGKSALAAPQNVRAKGYDRHIDDELPSHPR